MCDLRSRDLRLAYFTLADHFKLFMIKYNLFNSRKSCRDKTFDYLICRAKLCLLLVFPVPDTQSVCNPRVRECLCRSSLLLVLVCVEKFLVSVVLLCKVPTDPFSSSISPAIWL